MKRNKFTTLTTAALLAFSANSNAMNIDLFTTDQAELEDFTADAAGTFDYKDGSGFSSTVNTGGTDILGGNRDIGVNVLTTGEEGADGASVRVSSNKLTFSADAGVTAQGIIQWDGADANTAIGTDPDNYLNVDIDGLGGIDITEGGVNTVFQLETFFSDLGFTFTVQIWDMTGASVTAFLASSEVDSTTPVTSFLGLNTWSSCNDAGTISLTCLDSSNLITTDGVDLTQVGAIEFVISPFGSQAAIDLKLGSITAVPEPSTIALLGLGLFAAGFTARKKQA